MGKVFIKMKLLISEEEKIRILNLYNVKNELIVTESWDISSIFHTIGDVVSTVSDFIIPGSGAIIDTLNAVSYIIEAQYKPQQKNIFYLMAGISFAFVIIPGPLQMSAPILREFMKSGKVLNETVLKNGLALISKSIEQIVISLPEKVNSDLENPMAKNLVGKYGKNIQFYINDFIKNVKPLMANLNYPQELEKKI